MRLTGIEAFRIRIQIECGRDPRDIARVRNVSLQSIMNIWWFKTFKHMWDKGSDWPPAESFPVMTRHSAIAPAMAAVPASDAMPP
jgi:hypothetical protein